MAAVLPRPALSPQERESADLATTYASHGINPDAATMAAILLAVQRPRQSHGIDVATTPLAPQPNANGGNDANSPLAHLYPASDDAVRVAALPRPQENTHTLGESRERSTPGP